jgi:hypothetical protein
VSGRERVVLAPGADENGLAAMIQALIEQNLADHPEKLVDFERMRGSVAIVAEDAGTAVTLVFGGGRLEVHAGIEGVPDIAVRADSDDVVGLSQLELTRRFALPDLRGVHARKVLARSRTGHIRVLGALARPMLLLRLTRVMSIA